MTTEADSAASGEWGREAISPKACPTCKARYSSEALFCSLDGAPLRTAAAALAEAADPYLGLEIDGPIEIQRLLGLGSMGRVYRGFHRGVERNVAVKILHRELSANPALAAQFERQARVASRLRHPHVVDVLLSGRLPDGATFLVMEYLDGMSLESALLAAGGSLPLARALHITLALADAVGEGHVQGIVHRDVKPENVMLVQRSSDSDFVKVLDFGIARLVSCEPSLATAAGLMFGTARYMPPEAARGEPVGPQGDVYSIATMLYQMLAGRTPFEADHAISLLVQQIHSAPGQLTTHPLARRVPERIASVVMRNLAKRPEDRAPSGREFARAVLDAIGASGLAVWEILGAEASPTGAEVGSALLAGRTPTARAGETQLSDDLRRSDSTTESDLRVPATGQLSRPAALAAADAQGAPKRTLDIALPSWSPEFASGLAGHSSGADVTLDGASASARHAVPPTLPAPPPNASGLPILLAAPASNQVTTVPDAERDARQVPASGAARWEAGAHAWSRARTLGVIVACFLAGCLGTALIGFRSRLGGLLWSSTPTFEIEVAHANDALLHQRWDSPRGSNVLELTDDGLRRWPHEPELLRIRSLASADVVKAARGRRDEGNLTEALRLSRLAYELDPSDVASQKLMADLEAQVQAPTMDNVPPLVATRDSPSGASASSAIRASLEASISRPAVGQPVDFVAHVTGARPGTQGAGFHVVGPGVAPGATLDAIDGGSGVYRTTFAFLQSGRFDVSFVARGSDGSPVRASRILVVGGPPAPIEAGAAPAARVAAPSWM